MEENTLRVVRKKASNSFHTSGDKNNPNPPKKSSPKQEIPPNFGKKEKPPQPLQNDQYRIPPINNQYNNNIDRNKPHMLYKNYVLPSYNNNNAQTKVIRNFINNNNVDLPEMMNKQSPKNENTFTMKIDERNLNPIKQKTETDIPNKGDFDIKSKKESTQNDAIKKKLNENEFIKNNPKSLDLVKNSELNTKEMMKLLGYFQFLEQLNKKLVDSNETKILKEENESLKEIIEKYEIENKTLSEEKEKLKQDFLDLKSKLTEARGRETKLNNDLRKAQSKSPMPSRNSKKDDGDYK